MEAAKEAEQRYKDFHEQTDKTLAELVQRVGLMEESHNEAVALLKREHAAEIDALTQKYATELAAEREKNSPQLQLKMQIRNALKSELEDELTETM